MLEEILKDFNLSTEKIDKLNKLRKICLEYNIHTNLTSITKEQEFNIKHILDSIQITKYYELENKKILDVGSGGGFPGLVLAIVLNNSEVTMLDSNNKKITYIQYAINKLELKNTKTILARVEETDDEDQYDIVVSRAVAPLNILLEIISNKVIEDGKCILYKGSNLEQEMPTKKDLKIINKKLSLSLDRIYSFDLTRGIERKFISFNKNKKTNNTYPRKYNLIKKSPIF
ncbi:MAG: ribosomal RNA small subunit methyltransferase G [Candidatus Tyloplasma litorale]|nr:MAG: ribosomal RNA small subunit methyltransferase G [Mycoplasmatales bacterium]